MKLFPTKISDLATLQNLWRQRVTVLCYLCMLTQQPLLQRGFMNFQLQNFQLYNKSLKDWSLRKQLIVCPLNIEILRKQNLLFPKGPVIKSWIFYFNLMILLHLFIGAASWSWWHYHWWWKFRVQGFHCEYLNSHFLGNRFHNVIKISYRKLACITDVI